MVHLRRGETLRRYLEPGLGDGETFAFWGRNYMAGGIPGPERSRSWVNQPEAMHGSVEGTPHRDGQVRYANAVFVYRPDFETRDYRQGVVREDDGQVVFEFQSPYVIGATPPDDSPWGIYMEGSRNGLVLSGRATCPVALSLDGGATWREMGEFREGLDLAEMHLEYDTSSADELRVTFAWDDDEGNHVAWHDFSDDHPRHLRTGRDVRTRWIELEPAGAP